jgi:carbonic anhydrase/acetyltransferase-like protein (isoleucine patch superfamily)
MIRSVNGHTPKIHPTAFISEAAYIVGDVEIGEHSSVWPGAVLRADTGKVVVGKYTAIEDNAIVHSGKPGEGDTYIGDYCNIAHAAVIHCKKIGNNVMVGINATILHNAEIGNFCLIGAATLVMEDMKIPDHSFVVGVPGKIKSKVPADLMFWLDRVPKEYAEFGEMYKGEGLADREQG